MSGHRSDSQRSSGQQQGSDPGEASVPQRARGPRRRDFLRYSGGAAAAGGLAGAGLLAQSGTAAAAQSSVQAAQGTAAAKGTLAAAPIRPPAAPLAVRNPYLSTWLPATALPGTWEQFWPGHVTAMAGIARIDGTAYMFMGAPSITLTVPDGNHGTPSTVSGFERALQQTGLTVTPTRSVFTLEGGGVGVTVEFLSPVEPGDLRRQSVPMSYVVVSARSVDDKEHDVQIYADITGEWCSGDPSQQITWAPAQAGSGTEALRAWTVQLANQQPLTEQNQQAAWGTWVWATPDGPDVTYQSGQDLVVRAQFVNTGKLADSNDTNYRAISDNWPVFGLAADLGSIGGAAHSVQFSVGHVRTPAVSYLGQNLQPLWTTYFSAWQDMLVFFHADLAAARQRAAKLDAKITGDALQAGGAPYAGLCALALRQAYGGTELVVGPDGTPWAFLKEISSDGNVSTVDVLFPASPAWIYADPDYLALLLTPLLSYAESGNWPQPFAPHDLGSAYPVALAHNDGGGENMPVEESGNMLIMAAAYVQATARKDAAKAAKFAAAHYQILGQWADYLVANLPDPGYQNQTDDFAGSIAHSVNLALKGIVAVAAMGKIATVAGNAADAQKYASAAKQFMTYWTAHAQDPSAAHLDLTYSGDGGGDGTWGTTYNGFADALLGTGLIPESVQAEQAAWYESASNLFGLPLQVPHSYAKSDWELFTAAWLSRYPVKQQLIEQVYTYANTTPSRVPFSDLYDTISGNQAGFQARPVQGGIFALLTLM
jgi:glutaminase A-like protein/uncharacterized protein DUF5127/uncharacterized protein DUF4964